MLLREHSSCHLFALPCRFPLIASVAAVCHCFPPTRYNSKTFPRSHGGTLEHFSLVHDKFIASSYYSNSFSLFYCLPCRHLLSSRLRRKLFQTRSDSTWMPDCPWVKVTESGILFWQLYWIIACRFAKHDTVPLPISNSNYMTGSSQLDLQKHIVSVIR